MKRLVNLLIVLFLFLEINALGQSNFQYELSLVPTTVSGLPGLHSYAFAQHEGTWLIIGGRKDGLHARQPFNSFPESQNNTDLYVVDVQNNQLWTSSVNTLPISIREQLQSTNMNFHQSDDTLYIAGGYGFSQSENDHITHPYLTTIHISGLINAIQGSEPIAPYFKQIQDDIFAVTGGHLDQLNGTHYLIGGHRFDGRYNPMGNPTYTQSYTNQIRKFSTDNSGSQLTFSNYTAITDAVHLRRRDYNLLPQIFPNGEAGFTISSGVFQINANLPFLYPVNVVESGYSPVTDFNQYLSNYHSAIACMYDSTYNNMHSLFFGGMSQYYYQNGMLIQDDQVPFVKTISRLTRDANGNLTEYQLPIEMPALKGAGAEFIPNLDLPRYSNDVLKLHEISQSSFMIGHIFGGILSQSLNPFSVNQTNSTQADNTIYEVWLTSTPLSTDHFEIDGKNPYDVVLYPNPTKKNVSVKFSSSAAVDVGYFISNSSGQIIQQSESKVYPVGENNFEIELSDKMSETSLFLTLVFDDKYYVTKKFIKK